jgi:hypothetical protein
MHDISEFFGLISSLAGGFRARSESVSALLNDPERTEYYLIADARAPQRNDVIGFLDEIRRRKMNFAGFIVNRVRSEAPPLPKLPSHLPELENWPEWRAALTRLHHEAARDARQHLEAAKALVSASKSHTAWLAPELPNGIRSIDGLRQLAEHLPPTAPTITDKAR